MISAEERTILRDLAKAYRDLCDWRILRGSR